MVSGRCGCGSISVTLMSSSHKWAPMNIINLTPHHDEVRDEEGQVIGCRALGTFAAAHEKES